MSPEGMRDKTGTWLLKAYEDAFKEWAARRVPSWLETWHLTYLSVLWCALVLLCFALGSKNHAFLFAVSPVVALQYVTDVLDGAVGRHRNTGLIRWGYYVDHILDFAFVTAILLGYGLVVGFGIWLFLLHAIVTGLMVHVFLLVAATNEFKIGFFGFGPTEGRIFFCASHTALVLHGIEALPSILPYLVVVASVLFVWVWLVAQAELWKMDMHSK
jgi:phosphatidylglycerophosphate synthase